MCFVLAYCWGLRYGGNPYLVVSPHFETLSIFYGDPRVEVIETIEIRACKPIQQRSYVGGSVLPELTDWFKVTPY